MFLEVSYLTFQWKLADLHNLPSDELFNILEEIPPYNQFIHFDYLENSVQENNVEENNALFGEEPEDMNRTVSQIPDHDWESEDEVPVTRFLTAPKIKKDFR